MFDVKGIKGFDADKEMLIHNPFFMAIDVLVCIMFSKDPNGIYRFLCHRSEEKVVRVFLKCPTIILLLPNKESWMDELKTIAEQINMQVGGSKE